MSLTVCLAGTFEPSFSRNRALLRWLELVGHEVVTCRIDVWGSDRHDIPTRRPWRTALRFLVRIPLLIFRFLKLQRPDVVVVAYPGWFDVLILKPLCALRKLPLVFDMFISLQDTIVEDRRLVAERSVIGRLAGMADRFSCKLADRVIADTPIHARYFAEKAGIPIERFGVVWLGSNEDVFHPLPGIVPEPGLVVFHGTFVPLQGLETVIRAAKQVEGDGIRFRVIGAGQESIRVQALAHELGVSNVEFVGMLPADEIPSEIARASVCLGIFGTSEKASRVIPHKVFECLAVGRPVVTADTPAVRAAFRDGELALTTLGSPDSVAEKLRELVNNPDQREGIAGAGHLRFKRTYGDRAVAALLDRELREVLQHPALDGE